MTKASSNIHIGGPDHHRHRTTGRPERGWTARPDSRRRDGEVRRLALLVGGGAERNLRPAQAAAAHVASKDTSE